MVQTVLRRVEAGKQLDVLLVVDLDEGDFERGVGLVEMEGLVVAEEILVEGPRFFDITHPQGDMGHAQDLGALGLLRGQRQAQSQSRNSENNPHEDKVSQRAGGFHW